MPLNRAVPPTPSTYPCVPPLPARVETRVATSLPPRRMAPSVGTTGGAGGGAEQHSKRRFAPQPAVTSSVRWIVTVLPLVETPNVSPSVSPPSQFALVTKDGHTLPSRTTVIDFELDPEVPTWARTQAGGGGGGDATSHANGNRSSHEASTH